MVPKPPVLVWPCSLVATARATLQRAKARNKFIASTGIHSPMGEIVLVQVLEYGEMEIAGASRSTDQRTVIALLKQCGADLVLLDGALGRSHHASPAIAEGVILSTGAAIGGGGRRVIALQADGSAMYTVQGLWTQAREKLPVTTIILSNRKYQILIGEYQNVGANPGPTAMNMLDLGNPDIGWVKMAEAMGVEAAQATTLDQVADLMAQSFPRPGPFLIELVI